MVKPRKIKTTKAEFNQFVKECKRIHRVLGLGDWELTFRHHEITGEAEGSFACVAWNESATIATLEFNLHPPEKDCPIATAKHEMVHVATAKFKELAESRFTSQRALDDEFEKIAIIFQKIM